MTASAEATRAPRQSSSVILVRQGEPARGDGGQRVEVYMVRRSPRSEFAASVWVFPGGSVRQDDTGPELALACPDLTPERAHAVFLGRGGEPPPSPEVSQGLLVAALRELFEEAGVLLALEADGQPLRLEAEGRLGRLARARSEVEEGRLSLAALATREGLRLDWRALVYFSHWITPRSFPIRFDTRFFLAPLPSGQEALHGPRETTEGRWVSPAEALAKHARGEFPLVFATENHLRRLVGPSTVEALLRFGREKPIRSLEPPTRPGDGLPQPYLLPEHLPW